MQATIPNGQRAAMTPAAPPAAAEPVEANAALTCSMHCATHLAFTSLPAWQMIIDRLAAPARTGTERGFRALMPTQAFMPTQAMALVLAGCCVPGVDKR